MLGIDVKRGVASTLERVFNASGNRFDTLEILWSGKTAGIIHERCKITSRVKAKVLFPSIDETKLIPKETFNNLIGYALHELGHAWYTDNEPWDNARRKYGDFVSSLINGLEDPRIERLVIESGRAPNSRTLFENLVNSILKRDGYVKPDDKKNIPFLLAIEGRRLNGYAIIEPSIVDASPWAADLRWALTKAQAAFDTKTIVKIAIELNRRIEEQANRQPQDSQDPPQEQEQEQEQKQGQGEDGNQEDGQESGQDGSGQSGEASPSDDPGNGSESGSDGSPGEDGKDGDGKDGKPDNAPAEKGTGKSDETSEKARDVEPTSFIEDELSEHKASVDKSRSRPAVGKPHYAIFDWS